MGNSCHNTIIKQNHTATLPDFFSFGRGDFNGLPSGRRPVQTFFQLITHIFLAGGLFDEPKECLPWRLAQDQLPESKLHCMTGQRP